MQPNDEVDMHGSVISMNQALHMRSHEGGWFVAVIRDPETQEILNRVELFEMGPEDRGGLVELSVEFWRRPRGLPRNIRTRMREPADAAK